MILTRHSEALIAGTYEWSIENAGLENDRSKSTAGKTSDRTGGKPLSTRSFFVLSFVFPFGRTLSSPAFSIAPAARPVAPRDLSPLRGGQQFYSSRRHTSKPCPLVSSRVLEGRTSIAQNCDVICPRTASAVYQTSFAPLNEMKQMNRRHYLNRLLISA